MVKKYYIFRHGVTFATKAGTGYGLRILTAPILEEGIPSIKRIGEYLKDIKADYYVSSKIKRCVQTSDIVSEIIEKKFVKDRRINEFFIETFGSFKNRLKSFLEDLDQSGYETVVICTHGACIAGLRGLIINQQGRLLHSSKDLSPSDLGLYPDPGVLIVIDEGKYQEINFNPAH